MPSKGFQGNRLKGKCGIVGIVDAGVLEKSLS